MVAQERQQNISVLFEKIFSSKKFFSKNFFCWKIFFTEKIFLLKNLLISGSGAPSNQNILMAHLSHQHWLRCASSKISILSYTEKFVHPWLIRASTWLKLYPSEFPLHSNIISNNTAVWYRKVLCQSSWC